MLSQGSDSRHSSCIARSRAPASDPLELPVEFFAGEKQRRGPAVRAVMRVLGQVPLFQQGRDLPRRQAVAGFDGRLAGDHVQQRIRAGRGARAACRRSAAARPGRAAPRPAASWRASPDSSKPAPCRRRTVRPHTQAAPSTSRRFEHRGRFGGRKSTGSGTSSACDSSAPASTFSRRVLVQNPLVQRVLVDHDHAVRRSR